MAAIGTAWLTPLKINAHPLSAIPVVQRNVETPDEWFNMIKGRHRIIFDVTQPAGVMPFMWPRVFLITNEKADSPLKERNVVVVLQVSAIPDAFENHL